MKLAILHREAWNEGFAVHNGVFLLLLFFKDTTGFPRCSFSLLPPLLPVFIIEKVIMVVYYLVVTVALSVCVCMCMLCFSISHPILFCNIKLFSLPPPTNPLGLFLPSIPSLPF